jgi:hypothetical protein
MAFAAFNKKTLFASKLDLNLRKKLLKWEHTGNWKRKHCIALSE